MQHKFVCLHKRFFFNVTGDILSTSLYFLRAYAFYFQIFSLGTYCLSLSLPLIFHFHIFLFNNPRACPLYIYIQSFLFFPSLVKKIAIFSETFFSLLRGSLFFTSKKEQKTNNLCIQVFQNRQVPIILVLGCFLMFFFILQDNHFLLDVLIIDMALTNPRSCLLRCPDFSK